MRRPSGRMRPTLVTLLRHTWSKDVDGGRVISSTLTSKNVFCSVQPTTQSTGIDETGRWTTENLFTLRFSFDTGLNTHDEVTWVESFSSVTGATSKTHNLVVTGTSNEMARGATFEVNAIERL